MTCACLTLIVLHGIKDLLGGLNAHLILGGLLLRLILLLIRLIILLLILLIFILILFVLLLILFLLILFLLILFLLIIFIILLILQFELRYAEIPAGIFKTWIEPQSLLIHLYRAGIILLFESQIAEIIICLGAEISLFGADTCYLRHQFDTFAQ